MNTLDKYLILLKAYRSLDAVRHLVLHLQERWGARTYHAFATWTAKGGCRIPMWDMVELSLPYFPCRTLCFLLPCAQNEVCPGLRYLGITLTSLWLYSAKTTFTDSITLVISVKAHCIIAPGPNFPISPGIRLDNQSLLGRIRKGLL